MAGYIRTSTGSQGNSLRSQANLLIAYGCSRLYIDQAVSGRNDRRAGLVSLFQGVGSGDVVVATYVDRIWRNESRFTDMLEYLAQQRIVLSVMEPECDSRTSAGCDRLISLARDAEADAKLASSRTMIGLEEAKARGKRSGRKPVLTSEQVTELVRQYRQDRLTYRELAEVWGISYATVGDYVRRYQMVV